MSQKKKNIRLLIILGVLIVATGITYLYQPGDNRIDYDEDQFTLELNTVITTVIIESNQGRKKFDYINSAWTVNDEFLMDVGMRDVFFGVLTSVRIARPAASNISDSLAAAIKGNGLKVEILNSGVPVMQYWVAGSEDQSSTYFMPLDREQPYVMTIPGYQSYIAGIYEAPVSDWRDRFVFDANWSNLQQLSILYRGEELSNIELNYEGEFFSLVGHEAVDSAKVFDFIEEFSSLQTRSYLSQDDRQQYDSLLNTEPAVQFRVKGIGYETNLKLFLTNANERIVFGVIDDALYSTFTLASIRNLLVKPEDLLPDEQ